MIIGIDLGTTNSLVSVWEGETAQLVPNALGRMLTPSVVGLDDQGQMVVGDIARERLQTNPHLTTALFKRHMGSAQATQLGPHRFRPEELSALVLRSLLADAEAVLDLTQLRALRVHLSGATGGTASLEVDTIRFYRD